MKLVRFKHAARLSAAGMATVLCLLASVCHAGDVPTDSVVAIGTDGKTASGPLEFLHDGRVKLRTGGDASQPVEFAFGDLVSLSWPPRNIPDAAPTTILEFANGDRYAVEPGVTEDDTFVVHAGESRWQVPLEVLRGIVFRPSPAEDASSSLLLRETGENDLVLLENGDRIAGQLLRLTDRELVIDAIDREIRVPRERITAIAFAPDLTVGRDPDGERQIVHTVAGWLTVTGLSRRDDGAWSATAAFGQPVSWPANAVRSIQFAGDRVVFLSDLEPACIEFVPYFDRVWPVRKNRSVTGEPLTAGGETFARGLGVHSRCRVTFDLRGEYRSFSAVAGLAESAGAIGNVEFSVEIDGREVVRTGPVSRYDGPTPISHLDIQGAETLTLTVDFGRNGDVRDRANWCDAVLVR